MRLLVAIAALALPAAAFLGTRSWQSYQSVRDGGVDRAVRAARAAANTTSTFLGLAESLTVAFAQSGSEVLMSTSTCEQRMVATRDMLSFYAGLSVVDARGELVCTALPLDDGSRPKATDREWFRRLMSTGSMVLSEPLLGRVTGRRVIVLAVPVTDSRGTVAGAVSGGLALDELASLLRLSLPDEEAVITISDASRRVLARTTHSDLSSEAYLGDVVTATLAQGPGWEVFTAADVGGEQWTVAHVDLPGQGWTVSAGFVNEELYGGGYRSARAEGLAGLAILLVALLIAVTAYRDVTGHIDRLVTGVQGAAAGHSVPVLDGSPSEILTLAEHFNRTLDARARAEERHRDFLHNASFGSGISTEDGRFIEVNPALAHMLGYDDPDDLIAAGVGALYADEVDRAAHAARLRTDGHATGMEAEWVRKDGTPVLVRISGRYIRHEGAGQFEVLIEDITQQRLAEEEDRHRQKTDAIGRLAGGVAHEFNNLLTVIGGNAEMLVINLGEDHALSQEARAISLAVDRGAALTASLLAISRRDLSPPSAIDVHDLLQGLTSMLRRVLPEAVTLETELAADDIRVWMNWGHLEQVLLNLVLNSRDALPEGGTIRICTMRVPTLHMEGAESDVLIQVHDDGMGMDPELLERIFEPYFTTKPRGQGTGLGLATIQGLVSQAGGTLEVSSVPDGGSIFEIRLPSTRRE